MLERSIVEIIEKKYKIKQEKYSEIFSEINTRILEKTKLEQSLLKFIYSTLPLSDLISYSFQMIYSFVSHGTFLLENKLLGEMSSQTFLNYVLYPRVGSEELSDCRKLFYGFLKDRIASKGAEQTIIEVNYWCAEEVYYQSTDTRTASALSVYKSAKGRCGEESVFLVNALRSVGVPARQVYVPYWSHCDDNHAWVEVLLDGQWNFLGACEPEEVLNQGWFLAASTRAMLVHSRVFGTDFLENEEIADYHGCISQTNQIKRYAKTKQLKIKVKDSGVSVVGASVTLQLLNYAKLQPIARLQTDENGEVRLTTGFGSLFYEIEKNGKSAFGVIDENETRAEIMLEVPEKNSSWEKFFIKAPEGFCPKKIFIDGKTKAIGAEKLDKANKKRIKKIANFKNWEDQPEDEKAFLQNSFNNASEIQCFLGIDSSTYNDRMALLGNLSKKDFYDLDAKVLNEHLLATIEYKEKFPKEVFEKYLLSPRIGMEILTSYTTLIKNFFTDQQKEEFGNNPELIWNYVNENISQYPQDEHSILISFPNAVLESGVGSEISKKTLFVAICRTLGIPSRLLQADNSVEYYKNGKFKPIADTEKFELTLVSDGVQWIYSSNWSMAKWEDGVFVPLNFSGDDWQSDKLVVNLEAGYYRILTQNRITNGSVYGMSYKFFHSAYTKPISMELAEVKTADMLESVEIGNLGLTSIKKEKLQETNPIIFIWLEPGEEPTEHILNELIENSNEFKKIQENISFVLTKPSDESYHTLREIKSLFSNSRQLLDNDGLIGKALSRKVFLDPDKLPLVVVSHNGKSVYSICGYNVGTAEMLLKITALLGCM